MNKEPTSMSLDEYAKIHYTPEAIKHRDEVTTLAFERMDRLNQYLIENNCNTDDLIEAHKQLKNNE